MNKTFRFLLLLIFIALCFYFGSNIDLDPADLHDRLSRYPFIISLVVFVVLYVVVTFFVWIGAGDVFRIASAMVYGPYLSALLVYLAEMGNAVVLFNFSRRLGQDFVVQRLGIKKEVIDKSRGDNGFWGAFTLRINPLVPLRLQDLGAGLSAISFRKYMSAVMIATVPRIMFVQYVMSVVGMSIFNDPSTAMQHMMDHREIIIFGQIYFLAVIICTFYYFFRKSAQKKRALGS